MKIGILSDTHNHKENTRAALDIFKANGITRLLHCGDLTTPEIVALFEGWQIAFVLGNVDYDHAALAAAAQHIGAAPPQQTHIATIGGYRVAMTHGHVEDALPDLINRQEFRLVCHGHSHIRRSDLIGKTRVVNPGALGGRRPQSRSVAIADLAADTVEFIDMGE